MAGILIVVHEVTNVGPDRNQLSNMAKQASAAIGKDDLTVVADRGYFKSVEILSCHEGDNPDRTQDSHLQRYGSGTVWQRPFHL